VLKNRYDLQAAIYLFALHQLLQSRLGAAYDPEVHLGGAYVWYLRGLGSKGQGLCLLKPQASMMRELALAIKGGSPKATSPLPLLSQKPQALEVR
jgi:exodeoxyribonuclease V beta subunit